MGFFAFIAGAKNAISFLFITMLILTQGSAAKISEDVPMNDRSFETERTSKDDTRQTDCEICGYMLTTASVDWVDTDESRYKCPHCGDERIWVPW